MIEKFCSNSNQQHRIRKIVFYFFTLIACSAGAQTNPNYCTLSGNGINFSANNGNFTGSIGGYIYYDANFFQNNQNNLLNGSHPTTINSNITLQLYQNWTIYQNFNWASQPKLQNLYLSYNSSWFTWLIGQTDPNFGLSNADSSMYTPMILQPLAGNAFTPNYMLGTAVGLNNKVWSWSAGVYGPQVAVDHTGHAPTTIVSRLLYVPVHTDTKAMHLGLSLWQQYPDGSNAWSWGTVPEVLANTYASLVGTGLIENTHYSFTSDLEAAWIWNAYDLQAEYFLNTTKRDEGEPSVSFKGYYVQAGYFLTGESEQYSYPGGYISGISQIRHPYGAFQLNAQYSTLDLNSGDVRGGNETNVSLGLDWYINNNVIIKTQAIRVYSHLAGTNQPYYNNIYAMRLALQF